MSFPFTSYLAIIISIVWLICYGLDRHDASGFSAQVISAILTIFTIYRLRNRNLAHGILTLFLTIAIICMSLISVGFNESNVILYGVFLAFSAIAFFTNANEGQVGKDTDGSLIPDVQVLPPESTSLLYEDSDLGAEARSSRSRERWAETIARNVKSEVANISKKFAFFEKRQTASETQYSSVNILLTNINTSISEINDRLAHVEKRQDECEDLLLSTKEARISYETLVRRVQNASEVQHLQSTAPIDINFDRLERKLNEEGFYFETSLLKQCETALRAARPILFVGPTGNGKTKLAKSLIHLFWDIETAAAESHVSYFRVANDTHSSQMRGYENIEARFKSVYCGVFTESLLECIDKRGQQWLVVDELNHAHYSDVFGPLNDALENLHKRFHYQVKGVGCGFYIPETFRVICAMNESARGNVFDLTSSDERRFERIDVIAPKLKNEFSAVKAQLELRAPGQWTSLMDSDEFDSELHTFLSTISKLRKIGEESEAEKFVTGVATSIDLTRDVLHHVSKTRTYRDCFSASLCKYVSHLSASEPESAFRLIATSEHFRKHYPTVCNEAKNILSRRDNF